MEHDLFHLGDCMRLAYCRWVAGLAVLISAASVSAQTSVVPYTGGVNLAVNDAFTYVLTKRGYGSKDPRAYMTKRNVERRLTAAANATTVGTKIPWLKLAGRLATPLMVGKAVWELWDDYRWSDLKDDESGQRSVTVSYRTGNENGPIGVYPGNAALFEMAPGSYNFQQPTSPYSILTYRRADFPCPQTGYCSVTGNAPTNFDRTMTTPLSNDQLPADKKYWGKVAAQNAGDAPDRFTKAIYRWFGSEPLDLSEPLTQVVELEKAIDDLREQMSALAKSNEAIPDHVLASLINQLWMEVSSMDGSLPYSRANPVLASDIRAARDSGSGVQPKMEDLFSDPLNDGLVKIIPDTEVGGGDGGGLDPTPGGGVEVDFGSDPNVPAPELEKIPTAQMIMQPMLDLWPELREGKFATDPGQCPVGNFLLFGKEHVMNQHCVLFEDNRGLIAVAMVAMWSVLSLVIVLRA